MNKLLIVSGFGWSGSGLLIDALSSTGIWEKFPTEFRLFKDKGGIIDLFNCTEDAHRTFNYSIELENFENLCNVLARKNGIRFGLNYDKLTNKQFSKATNFFLDYLKKNSYNSDAFVFQYGNNFFSDIICKILRKFQIKKRLKKRYLPLTQNELKHQIFNLFNNLFIAGNEKQIILDQALDAGDIKTIDIFSEKFIMITIDRDPRDIFVDYVKSNDVVFDVKSFIDYFKIARKNIDHVNSNILRLNFEDIVYNSDKEIERVCDFLNITDNSTKYALKNYDFGKSKKNINLYKNFWDQDAIKSIENELSKYCYLTKE